MSDRIFIQPTPGITVRKPVGGYLATEGEEVNRDSYWLRRLADGDVVEVAGDDNQAATKTATKK